MTEWSITHRPASHPGQGYGTAEMWMLARRDGDLGQTVAHVYRRDAKRGPRWAVYIRPSERMLSHHAPIWSDIVAAVESHPTANPAN